MTVEMQERTCSTDVSATLFYAGDIPGRARFDVVEPERTNIALTPVTASIQDVRSRRDQYTLDDAGFAFIRHHSHAALDPALIEANLIHAQGDAAGSAYEDELVRFFAESTGARAVFPQVGGLIVRTSQRASRKSWAMPANFVHLDFTAKSARQFLHWSADAAGVDPGTFRRFVIYQTWRAISPGPQDNVLCICDGRSVTAQDAVVFDASVGPHDQPGGEFESRLCRPGPEHRWYYLSNMEPDDLLIFKGFDSDLPESMNAMHTAFDNPLAGDDAPPRVSVEARFILLFD